MPKIAQVWIFMNIDPIAGLLAIVAIGAADFASLARR
jgi:hypothetical protein